MLTNDDAKQFLECETIVQQLPRSHHNKNDKKQSDIKDDTSDIIGKFNANNNRTNINNKSNHINDNRIIVRKTITVTKTAILIHQSESE